MPASLTDYCKQGAVELTDGLSPEQLEELMQPDSPTKMKAARKEALAALKPIERTNLSALALLHAYAATHGKDCAFSQLKSARGPQPADVRDSFMVRIYRMLTGDEQTPYATLVQKSRILGHRRFTGGDNPSMDMRKSFSKLTLKPRQELGHVYRDEQLLLALRPDAVVTRPPAFTMSKRPDMDTRGFAIGDCFLVRGPPGDLAKFWYKARVRGFMYRCGLPPILITYYETADGKTAADGAEMPSPLDSACRKGGIRPLPEAEAKPGPFRGTAVGAEMLQVL